MLLTYSRPIDYVFTVISGFAILASLIQTVLRVNAARARPTLINRGFAIILIVFDICLFLQMLSLFATDSPELWATWWVIMTVLTVLYILVQIEVLALFLSSLGYSERFIIGLRVATIIIHFVFEGPFYVATIYNPYSIVWFFWDIGLDLFISIKLSLQILKSTEVWGENQDRASVQRTLIVGCVLVFVGYAVTAAALMTHSDPYIMLTSACHALHYVVGTSYLPLLASFSTSLRTKTLTVSKMTGDSKSASGTLGSGSTPSSVPPSNV